MAEQKINGTTYRVDRVPAPEAIRLQVRIGKVIGGGMSDMAMAVIGSSSGSGGADAAILKGIGQAFAVCDPEEVVRLASDIVGRAQIKTPSGDWAQVDIDSDLTERPADLYPLIGFVIKEALGAFFPAGAATRLARAAAG